MAHPRKWRRPRARNPQTQAQIRRDTIWQIALPLGLAVVVVLVLMVLVIVPSGAPVRSPWAAVSLMILIIPTAFAGLVVLALLLAMNYGIWFGLGKLPAYFKLAQDWVALASDHVQGAAKKVSNVILSTRSFVAGVKRAAADARAFLTFRRTS
jgi:hypothetical protein